MGLASFVLAHGEDGHIDAQTGPNNNHNNTTTSNDDNHHHQAPSSSSVGASLGQRSSDAVLGRSPRPSGFAGRCSPNGN